MDSTQATQPLCKRGQGLRTRWRAAASAGAGALRLSNRAPPLRLLQRTNTQPVAPTHNIRSWNFTPSPGWTEEEARTLKLCVMRHGVGAWGQIAATGLLPGKTTGQLSSQTQRLLGQQSLAGASASGQRAAGPAYRGPDRPWNKASRHALARLRAPATASFSTVH